MARSIKQEIVSSFCGICNRPSLAMIFICAGTNVIIEFRLFRGSRTIWTAYQFAATRARNAPRCLVKINPHSPLLRVWGPANGLARRRQNAAESFAYSRERRFPLFSLRRHKKKCDARSEEHTSELQSQSKL